ncbi:MAG: hypothetical protein ACRDSF_15180 [Pseudonocardiaceae bacterium]
MSTVAPPVVGLVGDRPIEPVVTDHAATVDSVGVPVPAPAAEQTRWPAVQRRSTVGGQVTGVPAVSRSSPGVSQQASSTQPVQFVQFAPAAPVAAESNPPEVSAELVVQRADDEPAAATGAATETDPATATGAPTATGPAAGTPPASPVGSTSPTEIDTLVRRLYDPIVRRLKAELQLDRERAGHSLDLRH